MTRGSSKGSKFERLICKRLSKWWSNDERDDIFWRTSQSGGRATSRAKKGKKTFGSYGDVQAVDPVGQPLLDLCSIELKIGYGKWSFLDCLDRPARSKEQTFQGFYKQAKEETKLAGARHTVIIAKRDKRSPIIIIPFEMYKDIYQRYGGNPDWWEDTWPIAVYAGKGDRLIAVRLNDFFDWCPPEYFQRYKTTSNVKKKRRRST